MLRIPSRVLSVADVTRRTQTREPVPLPGAVQGAVHASALRATRESGCGSDEQAFLRAVQ